MTLQSHTNPSYDWPRTYRPSPSNAKQLSSENSANNGWQFCTNVARLQTHRWMLRTSRRPLSFTNGHLLSTPTNVLIFKKIGGGGGEVIVGITTWQWQGLEMAMTRASLRLLTVAMETPQIFGEVPDACGEEETSSGERDPGDLRSPHRRRGWEGPHWRSARVREVAAGELEEKLAEAFRARNPRAHSLLERVDNYKHHLWFGHSVGGGRRGEYRQQKEPRPRRRHQPRKLHKRPRVQKP